MKIRSGFVSNSSSSSFLVIDGSSLELQNAYIGKIWNESHVFGERSFSWQFQIYRDVHSKVNFAFIQALSIGNEKWTQMIVDVIKKHTGAESVEHGFKVVKEVSDKWTYYTLDDFDSHIDHQSSSDEGANIEIFEDEEILKNFLFGVNSYIQNDNDNR